MADVERIAAIRARRAAATPGPWFLEDPGDIHGGPSGDGYWYVTAQAALADDDPPMITTMTRADAELIAAAPDDLAFLLDLVAAHYPEAREAKLYESDADAAAADEPVAYPPIAPDWGDTTEPRLAPASEDATATELSPAERTVVGVLTGESECSWHVGCDEVECYEPRARAIVAALRPVIAAEVLDAATMDLLARRDELRSDARNVLAGRLRGLEEAAHITSSLAHHHAKAATKEEDR
jgi:hypothetical protein